jgi:hypothetical protein
MDTVIKEISKKKLENVIRVCQEALEKGKDISCVFAMEMPAAGELAIEMTGSNASILGLVKCLELNSDMTFIQGLQRTQAVKNKDAIDAILAQKKRIEDQNKVESGGREGGPNVQQ